MNEIYIKETQMNNPLLTQSTLMGGDMPQPAAREYAVDFSEKYQKSKNKLIYAASFSIIIGLFVVDSSSGVLGVKLENLTDRKLEWIAWLAAAFFSANTVFRYLDERRTPETYLKQVNDLQSAFSFTIEQIKSANERCYEELNENRYLKGRVERIQEQIGLVSTFYGNKETLPELDKFLKDQLQEINQSLKDILKTYAWTKESVEKLPKKLDDFNKRVNTTKKYTNISGIRFLIFDTILPFSLFGLASLIQFFPSSKNLILSFVPA